MNAFASPPQCIWPVEAELGEGAMWHAASRSIYFVDIKGHRLYRCREDGSDRQGWAAPGQIGFVLPARDGGLRARQPLAAGLFRFRVTAPGLPQQIFACGTLA